MEAHAEGLEGRSHPAEVLAHVRPASGSLTLKVISVMRLGHPSRVYVVAYASLGRWHNPSDY